MAERVTSVFGGHKLCHPNVVPMETTEPNTDAISPTVCAGRWSGASLSNARCVRHPVVVGRVIRQQMTEVSCPQYHDMVVTVASDRADEPFDMPDLPRNRGQIRYWHRRVGRQRRARRRAISMGGGSTRRAVASSVIVRRYGPARVRTRLCAGGRWIQTTGSGMRVTSSTPPPDLRATREVRA